MLTKKQYQLLMLIDRRLRETGVPPSFDEMREALHLKSKSGIHRLISALEERGFIRRLPHRARALEILKFPENTPQTSSLPEEKHPFDLSVITARKDLPPSPAVMVSTTKSMTTTLPLYGKIAAGTPIEALRSPSDHIEISPGMVSSGHHYALTVEGDSMIEAGILDGDTVIIQKCDTAENGTIVVALIDSSEVTLKRLRCKGRAIALEPANRTYETRLFGPDRIQIQGRLVALIRSY